MSNVVGRRIKSFFRLFGFDVSIFLSALTGLPQFLRDYRNFKSQSKNASLNFGATRMYPCLMDRFAAAGAASGHYFFQDLVVAQKIFQLVPGSLG